MVTDADRIAELEQKQRRYLLTAGEHAELARLRYPSPPPLAERLSDLSLIERLRVCATTMREEVSSLESNRIIGELLKEAAEALAISSLLPRS